jgi:hypothetical protein
MARAWRASVSKLSLQILAIFKIASSVVTFFREASHRHIRTPLSTMLQLVFRSNFWGKTLNGSNHHAIKNCPECLRKMRHFKAQLDFDDLRSTGCCAHFGKRVVEINESHFLDCHRDQWDLYSYIELSNKGHHCVYHQFILVPQNHAANAQLKATQHLHKWQYLGECRASTMRLDIEFFLNANLSQRLHEQWKQHHFHIDIFMDQLVDRTLAERPNDKERRVVLSEICELQNKR